VQLKILANLVALSCFHPTQLKLARVQAPGH